MGPLEIGLIVGIASVVFLPQRIPKIARGLRESVAVFQRD